MTTKLQSASLLTAAAVFLFFLPAADNSGCGDGDVIIGDDGGGGTPGDDDDGGTGGTGGTAGTGGGSSVECVITGCSGQICANEEVASTCEYLPEYACYSNFGSCSADADGVCGWEPTADLQACLDNVGFCPGPDEPCMNAQNWQDCIDTATTCTGNLLVLESCPLQFGCDPN